MSHPIWFTSCILTMEWMFLPLGQLLATSSQTCSREDSFSLITTHVPAQSDFIHPWKASLRVFEPLMPAAGVWWKFLHLIWDIRASVISHDDIGLPTLTCSSPLVSHLVFISFITWWTCASSRLSGVSKHLPSTHSPLSSHTEWRRWMFAS